MIKKLSISTTLLMATCFHFGYANNNSIGENIYKKACVSCHAANVAQALNSPAAHDEKAWETRFAKAKQIANNSEKFDSAMDYLVSQVKTGVGAMPPGGLCPAPCEDSDIKAAIEFMSKNGKSK